MSQFIASNSYITKYSFSDLLITSTQEYMESVLEEIIIRAKVYANSTNVKIECANDLFDYSGEGQPLQDTLLEILNNDFDAYEYYIGELERAATIFIEYNNSESLVALIENQNNVVFPRHYAFVINKNFLWPNIGHILHTDSWADTLTLNSKFIANEHLDRSEFVCWSIKNYEHLDFHADIENTLKTIQVGIYSDYKYLLSHALNTLNQSYHYISTDPSQNLQDLGVIAEYTAKVGKPMTCTRQGSNKVKLDFSLIANKTEIINCEYHLKINWNDVGTSIPRGIGNPVRVYFSLKTYQGVDRKKFKIAHMGKHL